PTAAAAVRYSAEFRRREPGTRSSEQLPRRGTMGDKGGKKDKEKTQKQKDSKKAKGKAPAKGK
ncbi:MAG: hypothetical protein KJ058_14070, partial [Thermoanaerobaculia bacterium]|nr:hypothetical protein [Thermoanaerobaculia bacterium]